MDELSTYFTYMIGDGIPLHIQRVQIGIEEMEKMRRNSNGGPGVHLRNSFMYHAPQHIAHHENTNIIIHNGIVLQIDEFAATAMLPYVEGDMRGEIFYDIYSLLSKHYREHIWQYIEDSYFSVSLEYGG